MAHKKIEVGTYLVWDNPEELEASKRINTGIRPKFMTEGAACADLAIPLDVSIAPHSFEKIRLNIRLDIPEGYKGIMYPRSSLLDKYGLIQPVSIIDCDYKGIIHVPLYNLTDIYVTLTRGARIAQIEIVKEGPRPEDWPVSNEHRGQEGFGSTGDK